MTWKDKSYIFESQVKDKHCVSVVGLLTVYTIQTFSLSVDIVFLNMFPGDNMFPFETNEFNV